MLVIVNTFHEWQADMYLKHPIIQKISLMVYIYINSLDYFSQKALRLRYLDILTFL